MKVADVLDRQKLRDLALYVAQQEIGHGEDGGNNVGPDLVRYGAVPHEPWCAAFVSWCYIEAARRLEIKLPFRPSLGAKKLAERVGVTGRRYLDPELARPGDLVCWSRGVNPWSGHVGIVERVEGGLTHTIEGNIGAVPAKVRRLVHDVSKERLYCFAGV